MNKFKTFKARIEFVWFHPETRSAVRASVISRVVIDRNSFFLCHQIKCAFMGIINVVNVPRMFCFNFAIAPSAGMFKIAI